MVIINDMESLLNAASVVFQFFETGYYINLDWFSQFIKIIIEGVGIVGVGVMVFTLILKAFTTPFDIYQRVKMRKQTLIMRGMQDELDKLKKQYANDKNMYNTKMMELQKKNGYSMLGACLPMIVSLIILIYAVTCFQNYSQYANLSMYEGMASRYNDAVMAYCIDGKDYTLEEVKDKGPFTEDDITYTYYVDEAKIQRLQVESTDESKYLFYTYSLDESTITKEYRINVDRLYTNQKDAAIKAEIQAYIDDGMSEDSACLKYCKNIGAKEAANFYRNENNPSFLWIKNVWYPDVSYNHPIQDYSAFTKAITKKIVSDNWEGKKKIGDIIDKDQYNDLTAQLETEKKQPNGYFILIVLTIGLMAVSQIISMKSQKESSQYQTLDGQGAKQQKFMLIFMIGIYAITGFMWTSAFSIYIAVSSIFSILVTVITNLVLGKVFKKKEEEAIRQKYTRKLSWQQTDEGKKDKSKKKK